MRFLSTLLNTLRLRQNCRHFPDNIFKPIFLNENIWILIKISLKFDPKGPINSIPALVEIMAWCQTGEKPLSEPIIPPGKSSVVGGLKWWLSQGVNGPSTGRLRFGWSSIWHSSNTGSPSQQSEQTSILLGSGHFVWPSFLFWIHRIWWSCG